MAIGKRDPLVDILKGIGIVSVVLGHSGALLPGLEWIPSIAFVYLYHLMVFFFAAGMVYRPEKYSDPYAYIGRQIKAAAPLYVLYNLILLAFHNPISTLQLLEQPLFQRNDFIIQAVNIFLLIYSEPLAGALWFVPMFLFSKAFFAIGFQFAERFGQLKHVAHAIFFLASALLGLFLNHSGMFFSYHLQTAILGIPVIYLGYFFQKFRSYFASRFGQAFSAKRSIFLNAVLCLGSAASLFFFLSRNIGCIELSQNQIIHPILFYPLTAVGILFCFSLASLLCHLKHCTALFSFLGSVSFHIMAMHFIVFKAFDWIYGALTGAAPEFIMRFPSSFSNLGLLYSLLGIAVPAILVFLFRFCKKKIQALLASKALLPDFSQPS